jgi:hypothetical protein
LNSEWRPTEFPSRWHKFTCLFESSPVLHSHTVRNFQPSIWAELTDSVRFSPRHEWRRAYRLFSEEMLLLLWGQEMEQGSAPRCICAVFRCRIFNTFTKNLKAAAKWQEAVTNSRESHRVGYRSDEGREINRSEARPNRLGAR